MSRPSSPVREAELLRAAKHALGFHSAQFADLDLEIARQHSARQRERNFVAHLVVLRAAHDLPRGARAIVHLADAEAVRIRVLDAFAIRATTTLGIATPSVAMPSTSIPASVSKSTSSGTLGGKCDQFTQPVKRDFHGRKKLELREEALIVFGEGADIRRAGHDHRQPIEAEAKREAGVFLRIEGARRRAWH